MVGLSGCEKKQENQAAAPAAATKPADPLVAQAAAVFAPLPDSPPALEGNPATEAKVSLGKMLFLDPRLSKSQLISCNSCHNLGLAGADLQATSTGHKWQQGPRNAPTAMNAVFHVAQFWDGRAKDLEAQAKGPVQAGVEMGNTPAQVEATLKSIPGYVAAFGKAFEGQPDPVSFDNMAKAIAVFEATLITPSRFDQFLKGDAAALNTEEKAGLTLFMDKGCSSCHNGIGVGGGAYFKFGVVNAPAPEIRPLADKGRMNVTKDPADEYVFRVPTLRNIELTGPYFHSGKVTELGKAVEVMANVQLGLTLTEPEKSSILAFLKSLTGEQPKVEYPVLPGSTSTTPLPNLDLAAK
ncbi:MAG: cytochrome C peroxidase [Candidatus Lambdaproteobacteria bacterium RIFOXYD1_FULL_56_27]|uniref:Cytochrome C peroxidase n=1 Tax=Candidatus Lambdaproteobacteria bacterium RIFOXYD2_FULL_56_26 TaxID=1817773 RepID=A0A1F6GTX1_9PROT|nr:MAG: cytochrome C peroxidase [Candidatus Lambdaproteobacteria bacterium RIFOXYC1_FULL_56_13]OGH01499.1 MAG: cytochrome C peroxidase [Candidatus Lambdaproteobacteria bacterium RIFOXYD2_FULL_56_26]OGH06728.1 MAG: cytochrome C peroxidase [Candidatus Lambdaproteobacteria bacterium RIFOXYD1_FULL_56_27]